MLYYIDNTRPLSNIVFITDDFELIEYARMNKYTGVFLSSESLKKPETIRDLSNYWVIFEKLCDTYVVCVSDSILPTVVMFLSLSIVIMEKRMLKNYLISKQYAQ